MKRDGQHKPMIGGTLVFRIPFGGRARFDWRLDHFEHDALVECTSPWKGLKSDVHQIGMGPRFTPDEARKLAEYDALAKRLQDKAMRLNELGIMSDAAYHRFEDAWATGVYYTDDRFI